MEKDIYFIKVTNKNISLATKIQNTIFPLEDATANYKESINGNSRNKEQEYFIIYYKDNPVGIIGLYSYIEYPNVAWLGWFGILEQYRKKGYGKIALNKIIEMAKQKKYEEFRIYTDETLLDAQKLYSSFGMIKEVYDNPNDKDKYLDYKIYIYSMSLNSSKIKKWNNKIIWLKEQSEKEH